MRTRTGSGIVLSLLGGCLFGPGLEARPGPTGPGAGRGDAQPSVIVRQDAVDLGVVPAGARTSLEFALENGGGGLLELKRVETSCDCTLVDFDRSIPPGKVGFVRVSLDSAELQGPVTKGVVVHTNDPLRSTVVLTLRAIVLPGIELLPQPVIFMRTRAGEPEVGRLLVRQAATTDGTLAIHDLRASSDALVLSADRLEGPRPRGGGLPEGRPGDWIIEVRFREGLAVPRTLRESVRFRTGLPVHPEVRVEVESTREAPVHLSTSRLVLASDGQGAGRGLLFASVRPGLDPARLRVEAPSPFGVEVERTTERMFKISVRSRSGAPVRGSVRFSLGDDTLELPVEWQGR